MKKLIRGGMIYDGENAPYRADALIENGLIRCIGTNLCENAEMCFDATNLCITPGFVDIHRHHDIAVLAGGFGEAELAQGITSVVGGNCGLSPVPMAAKWAQASKAFLAPCLGTGDECVFADYPTYFNALDASTPRVNMGLLAAFGAIKLCVKGFEHSLFSDAEIKSAQALLVQALDAGALGVSLGVMYPPECYTTTEEYTRILRVATPYGRPLCCHIRGEGVSLLPSIKEVLAIAERAELPLHISHFKATGVDNWHDKIHQAIELIEQARAKGRDVTADFYPYTAGASTLISLVPPTVLDDDREALWKKLATIQGHQEMRDALYQKSCTWENMVQGIGWERIVLSSAEGMEEYTGLSFDCVAAKMGLDDPSDAMCEVLARTRGNAGVVLNSMCQEDVEVVAKLPYTLLISDALYGGGAAHPRQRGAFPRFMREWVPDVLTMQEAIRKMTSLPAQRLGLVGRGRILEGYHADIAVFDPTIFTDQATYVQPALMATGMRLVLVNGEVALRDGCVTEEFAGKRLQSIETRMPIL